MLKLQLANFQNEKINLYVSKANSLVVHLQGTIHLEIDVFLKAYLS